MLNKHADQRWAMLQTRYHVSDDKTRRFHHIHRHFYPIYECFP